MAMEKRTWGLTYFDQFTYQLVHYVQMLVGIAFIYKLLNTNMGKVLSFFRHISKNVKP